MSRNTIPSGSSSDSSGTLTSIKTYGEQIYAGGQQMLAGARGAISSGVSAVAGAFGLGGNNNVVDTDTTATTAVDAATTPKPQEEVVRTKNPLDNIRPSSSQSEVLAQFRNDRHKEFVDQNRFAVRLKSMSNKAVVAFRVSPDINETRNAAYKTIDPIHMPGAIQIFTHSSPRTWSLSGIKLISRNGYEAEENLATINQLRSWMMPFFGETDTAGKGTPKYEADLLGAPPEVLEFTAYSDKGKTGITNIRKIPTVMTNLSIPYPTDVDYIETALTKQPFPTVMSIDIILVETHSPREFAKFDLIKFRNGELEGFN